jgi:putative FmdB family regulatory protein
LTSKKSIHHEFRLQYTNIYGQQLKWEAKPMPIYEYRCEACGNVFEKLVRNSQETPDACPGCGSESFKKLFSSFSPSVSTGNAIESCPAASECPTGSCCSGGSCPF